MLTRARFHAYDPQIWVDQTYLNDLGFGPLTVDGIWGAKTQAAALAFRSYVSLPAASEDQAGIADAGFHALLEQQALSQGYDAVTAPATGAGGSGTTVQAQSSGGGTSTSTLTASAPPPTPSSSSGILPILLVGGGAVALFYALRK